MSVSPVTLPGMPWPPLYDNRAKLISNLYAAVAMLVVAGLPVSECAMIDIFYTTIAAGLFIAACAYAWGCAKI